MPFSASGTDDCLVMCGCIDPSFRWKQFSLMFWSARVFNAMYTHVLRPQCVTHSTLFTMDRVVQLRQGIKVALLAFANCNATLNMTALHVSSSALHFVHVMQSCMTTEVVLEHWWWCIVKHGRHAVDLSANLTWQSTTHFCGSAMQAIRVLAACLWLKDMWAFWSNFWLHAHHLTRSEPELLAVRFKRSNDQLTIEACRVHIHSAVSFRSNSTVWACAWSNVYAPNCT